MAKPVVAAVGGRTSQTSAWSLGSGLIWSSSPRHPSPPLPMLACFSRRWLSLFHRQSVLTNLLHVWWDLLPSAYLVSLKKDEVDNPPPPTPTATPLLSHMPTLGGEGGLSCGRRNNGSFNRGASICRSWSEYSLECFVCCQQSCSSNSCLPGPLTHTHTHARARAPPLPTPPNSPFFLLFFFCEYKEKSCTLTDEACIALIGLSRLSEP